MGHLIPYINGLVYLGRPARVGFPIELLSQGISVLLSGLNNTMAIQSNPGWVWPYWVERQTDPDAPEFIPTGLNLIKGNLAHRNWTALGVEGSPREAMLDPVGMLTLAPWGWSMFPYLRAEGRSHFPPRLHGRAKQSLVEGDLPIVLTDWDVHPDLEWDCESLAVRLDGHEFILQTHRVKNTGGSARTVTLGITLRPYNVLAVGHINKIHIKKRTFRVNGLRGIVLEDRPHSLTVADRHLGDPLLYPLPVAQASLLSRSGLATGVAEWTWTLAPGEERKLRTLGDLHPALVQLRPPKPRALFALAQGAREEALDHYRANRLRGMALTVPDRALTGQFMKVKNHLHVFDDVTHFSPGSFLYHGHWFRDSSFIAQAFDHLGWFEQVRPKLKLYPREQTASGFFRSQLGEWDSNGEAIFTLVRHARLSGNRDFLADLWPAIRKGAHWVDRTRRKQNKPDSAHFGLLPAGFSAEHFGPNDHYFWDNFWGLSALKDAAWTAKTLGLGGEARHFGRLFQEYGRDLGKAVDRALTSNDPFTPGQRVLPSSPYRHPDTACIGTLVALSPLDLLEPETPWVRPTIDYLLKSNLREGLFFQKIVHTGLNPYLTVQLARALLVCGDRRWLDLAQRLAESATPTGTWPEAIHPRKTGGCMGDGDHGWSAAEYVNLLRHALVTERGQTLRLGCGIEASWIDSGEPVEVRDAPTLFGRLSYRLAKQGQALRLRWELVPHALAGDCRLEISLPGEAGRRTLALAKNAGEMDLPAAG
ncbi:MAG: hypothetical protein J0L75_16825 [Spirochaetes bacterium]|nr:hypothetical protein [Spirochaetota bacterium]